jgi:chromosome segregation ATPase
MASVDQLTAELSTLASQRGQLSTQLEASGAEAAGLAQQLARAEEGLAATEKAEASLVASIGQLEAEKAMLGEQLAAEQELEERQMHTSRELKKLTRDYDLLIEDLAVSEAR